MERLFEKGILENISDLYLVDTKLPPLEKGNDSNIPFHLQLCSTDVASNVIMLLNVQQRKR